MKFPNIGNTCLLMIVFYLTIAAVSATWNK